MNALESHLQRQIEGSQDFFWQRVRQRAVANYLPAARPFALVDVGAGAGLLGAFLAERYPSGSYRFIEPLDSLQRHLENRYGTDANARNLESFEGIEYVTLLDVLEHQEDDGEFLHELARRMEPGALLLITVPALPRLWSAWDASLGHHRRYTRRTLLSCIEQAPLRVLEVSYLFPELVPLGWVRRWRTRRHVTAGPGEESATFPDLPKPVNQALYATSMASLRLRRLWPAGTSLFAALRRSR